MYLFKTISQYIAISKFGHVEKINKHIFVELMHNICSTYRGASDSVTHHLFYLEKIYLC